jgi:hypothetical protein
MMNEEQMNGHQRELQQAQINRALGVFLLFFALVIFISCFFTETTVGKLTNLAAGGIIGLIGGLMVCRSGGARRPRD